MEPNMGLFPDGRRLHLNHGPIDLVIEAFGLPSEVEAAYRRAQDCFPKILPELVEELHQLRKPLTKETVLTGPVAKRMVKECEQYTPKIFVTPMAAVAGAVADEVLELMLFGTKLDKAYVNNGGDTAFFLTPGENLTVGLVTDYYLPNIEARCTIGYENSIRGIATSGWKGRSYSLGIADSVTVMAKNGAGADVAATLIANEVNIQHSAIQRKIASDLDPDSDLCFREVTVDVGSLDEASINVALNRGENAATKAKQGGQIEAAVLVLKNKYRIVGTPPVGLLSNVA